MGIEMIECMEKLNLKHGDLVRIKNTGSEMDGTHARVVGLASRNVLDMYILDYRVGLEYNPIREMPDFGMYSAFCMWEACLERVNND